MSKYSFEFKRRIVSDYLQRKCEYGEFARKYDIPHKRQICTWVKAYESFGDNGLKRSRKNECYSFECKLHVVELCLSTEVSYQELVLSEGINNPSLITKWVNDFRIAGPDALRLKKKGRKKSLESSKKVTQPNQLDITPIDTSAKHIKRLEDELLKLRIENAYLKELRRLRLEEEAILKKQRESSTASEETSN